MRVWESFWKSNKHRLDYNRTSSDNSLQHNFYEYNLNWFKGLLKAYFVRRLSFYNLSCWFSSRWTWVKGKGWREKGEAQRHCGWAAPSPVVNLEGLVELVYICFKFLWLYGNNIFTVVWNDYLLIFWPKCHISLHKLVGNPVQMIIYVKLSRFQLILKLQITFVESLFTSKPFIGDFYKFRFVTKWGCYSYFKLLIMLEYQLCCLLLINKILLVADVFFALLFLFVDNNISVLNHKIIFDQ